MRSGTPGTLPPQLEETLTRTGHFLFNDLLTPLGPALDELRAQADIAAPFGDPVGYHTFSSYRVVWPRRQILLQTAHRLCARLVQHWMSKDASALKEDIRTWATEQWEAQGFRPESLITQAQELCASNLQQAPEKLFQDLIDPAVAALNTGQDSGPDAGPGAAQAGGQVPDPSVRIAAAVQAADALENLLGIPEECRTPVAGPLTVEACPMEKAVQEAVRTMAAECEQKLSELVVRLFEEPVFRLAGAEELIRQFVACIQNALESQEPLCRELEERTFSVYQRLHVLLEGGTPVTPQTTPRWFGRRTVQQGKPGSETVDLLRVFAKCRYQGLVLQYVNGLYVRLRGFLSDQMREIGFCRTRLLELDELIRGRISAIDPGAVAEEILLPHNCSNVDAVAKQIDVGVSREDLLAFDKQAQALVVKQCHSLVNVCMAPSTMIVGLTPCLIQEAEDFLEPRLEGADVASMFLTRYPEGPEGETRLEEDLTAAYEKAAPELASVPSERELCVIAVPRGASGDQLRQTAGPTFPRARLVTGGCDDELLIFRSNHRLDPADTDALGDVGQEAYRLRTAQDPFLLHSRIDVEAWRPMDAFAVLSNRMTVVSQSK
jgi:hypothetical protein